MSRTWTGAAIIFAPWNWPKTVEPLQQLWASLLMKRKVESASVTANFRCNYLRHIYIGVRQGSLNRRIRLHGGTKG